MKKYLLLVSILISISYPLFSQVSITRYLVAEHRDDTLKVLDSANFSTIRSIQMYSDSIVRGVTGLSVHPITGQYYILFRSSISSNRCLGILDPKSGHINMIGLTGDRIASIAFLPSGKLIGVTGTIASNPYSLFEINITTAVASFIRGIGSTEGGEALAYCKDNGHIYHRSGIYFQELAKVDTVLYNVTQVNQVANPDSFEVFCMNYLGNSKFIAIGYTKTITEENRVYYIDTNGVYRFKMTLDLPYKGIVPLTCTRDITGNLSFCQGSSTLLTASANALSYQWYKNGVKLTNDTNQIYAVTSAGKYNCIISDLCGSDSLPASLSITAKALPSVSLTGSSSFCFGGSTLLTGSSGGTSQWYKNGVAIVGATSNTYLVTSAGRYNMTKTNSNGCADSAAVGKVVVMNPKPTVVVTAARNLKCNNDSSGSIAIAVSGGTSPFTYAWSNASTAADLTSVGAGNYQVIVTDSKSCKDTVSASISQPTAIQIVLTADPVKCNNGTSGNASAVVSGGSGNLTYSWSNSVVGLSNPGLAAGNYIFTATDDSLCVKRDTAIITEPSALSISVTPTNVLCNGGNSGAAAATGLGGTAPYQYSWSTGASTASISNLTAAYYTVYVTDANACSLHDSVEVVQPSALGATFNQSNVSCNGLSNGTITATASGGTGAYSYSWSNGGSAASVANLSAGTYTVFIGDGNSCSYSNAVNITEPAALVIDTIVTSANGGLNNGAINITVSGGTSPYAYSWSNGSQNEDISNLAPGLYSVTVTDANNCFLLSATIPLIGVGLNNLTATSGIQVFPNPNNGNFQIKASEKMQLLLYNSMNQLVGTVDTEKNKSTQVDFTLAPGIYYLKGFGKFSSYNQRIVITK